MDKICVFANQPTLNISPKQNQNALVVAASYYGGSQAKARLEEVEEELSCLGVASDKSGSECPQPQVGKEETSLDSSQGTSFIKTSKAHLDMS